jgi:hypothetical protein
MRKYLNELLNKVLCRDIIGIIDNYLLPRRINKNIYLDQLLKNTCNVFYVNRFRDYKNYKISNDVIDDAIIWFYKELENGFLKI